MRKITAVFIFLCLFLSTGTVWGESPEIEVLEINLPKCSWGEQPLEIKAVNHSEWVKFLVAESQLEFPGTEPLCSSEGRSATYVEPGSERIFRPTVEIPGNYGKATLRIQFYDVVDSLDALEAGKELFDTTLYFEIDAPESALPYMRKTVFPPRVNEHPYFNNDFVRMLFPLMAESKSREEIAAITGTDTLYVERFQRLMAGHRYLDQDGEGYRLAFPLISREEAVKGEKLASETAERLAEVIAKNLKDYRPLLDSMVEAGAVTRDSQMVLGTSTLLYRPECLTSAFLLWEELGSKFITQGQPLMMYQNTDICNATIPQFNYAAPSEENLAGRHFYAHSADRMNWRIMFADHSPRILCSGNFPARRGVTSKAHWASDREDSPEFFVVDTALNRPFLDLLGRGTDEIIDQTMDGLKKLAADYERETIGAGYRYWFWNLVATRTLDRLVKKGTISFKGNPYFHFGALTGE